MGEFAGYAYFKFKLRIMPLVIFKMVTIIPK